MISQSPTDVQPVFEAMAASARKLCRATIAGVSWTFDGELIQSQLPTAIPEWLEALRSTLAAPAAGSAAGGLILTQSVLHPDVREDPEYRSAEAMLAQRLGFGASWPSRCCAREPIGVIGVSGAEPAMFTERQIAMLQTFADQAVIAIENTRLFNELQARTAELGRSVEELKALGEVGSAVSSTLDLDTVLTTILTHAQSARGDTGRTGLRLRRSNRRATPSGHARLYGGHR